MANTTKRKIPSNLPEVDFVDTDTEKLVNKLITGYEAITGRTLYPADPVRTFILWLASVIIQERVEINESAKQNLPRYATGENLDSLSEIFHNTTRLQPEAATVTLKFTITTELDYDYVISNPMEVTADGITNFVTTENIKFKTGETTAEVTAMCTTTGEIGNGFIVGSINKLVSDEFLYFGAVTNTTESDGGSETETDNDFYNRLRESEETYSTAGPSGSYIYHAKTASSMVGDVSAESPEPGVCVIKVLLHGGGLPTEEVLQKVEKHLSRNDVRPLTDKVIVEAPDTIPFDIEAVYYISAEKASSTEKIRQMVDYGVQDYISWQTEKMGRDINPSYLNALLMQTGIKRLEIKQPGFAKIPKGSVAVINSCNVTFGGVEDE